MIPLHPLLAALAFLDPRQLFQFLMPSLYRRTHLVLVSNNPRIDKPGRTIRDHPINVTICSDPLEKLYFKRNFLQLDFHSMLEPFRRPLDLVEAKVAVPGAETDPPVFFNVFPSL